MSATVRSRTRSRERRLVEHVVRLRARPPRGRRDDVRLRPRHLVAREELDAVLVEDPGEPPVQLRERDELASRPTARPACCGRRSRPCRPSAPRRARARASETVAGRPRVRAQPQRRRRRDVARDELRTTPRNRRCRGSAARRRARPHRARRSPASASTSPRGSNRLPIVRGLPVSSHTTGAPRATSHVDRIVEPLPDEPLQPLVAAGHSRGTSSNSRWRKITHDESSIEPPARVPFSRTTTARPSSRSRAAATSPAMPAPATEIAHVRLNVGLCSTYSIRTRSGPHRNAAYVFAASTTDSTSMPSSPRVGDDLVGRVDEHGEVVEERPVALRRVALREARGMPRRPRRAPARRARSRTARYSSAVASGSAEPQRDVVEVVLDVGRRLDERHEDPFADVEDLRRPVRQLAPARRRDRRRAAPRA